MNLTDHERRLILAALWYYKTDVVKSFDKNRIGDGEDVVMHELETVDAIESAVRKMGGDPSTRFYGAPEA